MKTKLKDITTQYRKFDTNQVLTEGQLNEFLDYFDDQDRLSRTGLNGVGIACGFKLTHSESENSITITQGRGVTTDGDLLALQNPSTTEEGQNDATLKSIDLPSKKYKFYRPFIDDKVKYNHFLNTDNNQIDLWELSETNDGSFTDLATFTDLENAVVLLYLENYSKEGALCNQLTCDNQGIEQVSNIKVLLVSARNARFITDQDIIYNKHNWYETVEALPEVKAKRVVLNNTNTATFETLKENYFNAIKNNSTLTNLKRGLEAILSKFNKQPISTRIDGLFNFSSNGTPTDYQYRYDILKDLIDTYNEIKTLLLHINVACCPSIGAFPKHLMLGRIEEVKPYLTFRHQFYKSPIIGHEEANYKKVMSLLNRVADLATSYVDFNKGDDIKITPSFTSGMLGNKAVPFYYNVDEELLKSWSFEKFSNLRYKYNLSYQTQNLAQVPSILQPLEYDIDNYNFYRIEGHQGKLYKDALDQILRLKENNGLNFDVKVLSINVTTQTLNLNDYKCQFEDLSMLLNAWRTEQNCILSEMSRFFSAFSTVDVGTNVVAVNSGLEYELATPVIDSPSGGGSIPVPSSTPTASFREVEITAVSEELTKDALNINRQVLLTKNNIVKDQLTTEENTIGQLLEIAIADNEEGSANDILATFNANVVDIKQSPEWEAEAPLAEFIFTNVAETLVHSYVLDDKIPDRLTEIDDFTLTNYKLTIDELCKRVKDLQAKYQTTNVKEGSKQILGLIINQLSTVCCSGKKLEILLEEIEKRKQDILTQIQLSEFVKKHPGLEHKAGVKEGGTFVMAYLTENAVDKPTYEPVIMELDFLKQPTIENKETGGDRGELQLLKRTLSTSFIFLKNIGKEVPVLIDEIVTEKNTQTSLDEVVIIGESIEETVNNFSVFLNRKWERAGVSTIVAKADRKKLTITIEDTIIKQEENFIRFENPNIVGTDEPIFFDENAVALANTTSKNVVVADFALPYMCCSDCTPINFIVPKDPISLSLPQAFICLKDGVDITPLPFKISPADGVAAARVPEGIASGLTTNGFGEPIFDPALTDSSLYGTEIEFTVNGELTNAKITVFGDPNISVNTPQVTYNNTKTVATVTYTVVNALPSLNYTWDFGKGALSNDIPNSDGEVVVTYNLPINNVNTITPTLTISNGFCEDNISIDTIIFDTPITATLSIQDKYCLDLKKGEVIQIPFTEKSPADATIEIASGDFSGVKVQGDELVITPSDFDVDNFDKIIKFSVSGLPTSAEITISQLLNISLQKQEGTLFWANNALFRSYGAAAVVPNGIDESTLQYEWIINGKTVATTKGVKQNLPVKKGVNSYDIELQVTNAGGCVSVITETETINYPAFSIEFENNKTEFCLNDSTPYPIKTLPTNVLNTVPVGLGVVLQSGKHVFIPSATNLVAPSSVAFSIEGDGDTLLTVTLKAVSMADFTAKIEPGDGGDTLVLSNTSEVSDSYVWNVGGQIINRPTRTKVSIPTKEFETNIISIALRAISECGSDTKSIKSFKVRDEQVACIPETIVAIQADEDKLVINPDLSDPKNGSFIESVLMPVKNYYKIVNGDQIDSFLKGEKNLELFNADFRTHIDIVGSTLFSEMSLAEVDLLRFSALSRFFIAQTKLVFNVLHCQPANILENQKDELLQTIGMIKSKLEPLFSKSFVFDFNNELKDYLTAYSEEAEIVDYIRSAIKDELLPLILSIPKA
jgi:hypothetical protein